MKSYLEIKVPIEKDATWFKELRDKVDGQGINVRWQNAFYHITIVFIYDTPKEENLRSLFWNCLQWRVAPILTFDKLDVFAISSSRYILYLTAEHPSEEFSALVEEVREAMAGTECDFDQNFRLHVTLGRVFDNRNGLSQLKGIADSVEVPPFTLHLSEAQYLEYRGSLIDKWTMWPDSDAAAKAKDERMRRAFQNAASNLDLIAF